MAKSHRTSVAALDRSPSHLLHRALQLALDVYAEETAGLDITQRQYAVLSAVAADEGLSQTDLVRATGIDRSTLADMVARMIGKGWLARERSASDARANTVRLTVAGRETLDAAAPKAADADRRILEVLGTKKRDPFVDALRRLAKAGEPALLPEPGAAAEDAGKAARPKKAKKGGKGEKKKKRKARERAEAAAADVHPTPPAEPDLEDRPSAAEPIPLYPPESRA